ncbi:hypothetical protein EON77_13685 [bacterium]|nr:MAG: hypothetical protein EON77_13685 [bacterium]
MNIPIYIKGKEDQPNGIILLPISNGTLRDIKIGADGNCIGGFDDGALTSTCDLLTGGVCTKWKTAGSLGGYISLEEADKVVLEELENRTLCSFLTNFTTGKSCERDAAGKIVAKGDYCSTTNAPEGCKDAFWVAATFAASAVKIHDGASEPRCAAR